MSAPKEPTILDAYRWLDDAGLPIYERGALLSFLRSEGEDGPWIAWVAVEELQWRLDVDPKTIRKAVDGLVEKRILTCVEPATSTRAARYRIGWSALRDRANARTTARKAAKVQTRARGRPRKMGRTASPPISENGGDGIPPYFGKMGGTASLIGGDGIPNRGGPHPPEKPTEKPTEKPLDLAGQTGAARVRKQPPAPEPKASRLPPDWRPSPEARTFAQEHGLDPEAVAAEFRDYWISVPGEKGRKLDWLATWRNHCRRQAERQTGRPRPGSSPCRSPRRLPRLRRCPHRPWHGAP